MTQDVEQVFAKLPSGFFGEVTIRLQERAPLLRKGDRDTELREND